MMNVDDDDDNKGPPLRRLKRGREIDREQVETNLKELKDILEKLYPIYGMRDDGGIFTKEIEEELDKLEYRAFRLIEKTRNIDTRHNTKKYRYEALMCILMWDVFEDKLLYIKRSNRLHWTPKPVEVTLEEAHKVYNSARSVLFVYDIPISLEYTISQSIRLLTTFVDIIRDPDTATLYEKDICKKPAWYHGDKKLECIACLEEVLSPSSQGAHPSNFGVYCQFRPIDWYNNKEVIPHVYHVKCLQETREKSGNANVKRDGACPSCQGALNRMIRASSAPLRITCATCMKPYRQGPCKYP